MLLEALFGVEGDVVGGTADIPGRPHPCQVSVMQHLGMTVGAMDFLEKFLSQWLHLDCKQNRAAVWRATLCLRTLSPLVKALPQVSQMKKLSDHLDEQHKVKIGIRKVDY